MNHIKTYTKEQLVAAMHDIFDQGWHKSVKKTVNKRNDGAVGNTLETLLHLPENNLPIPNTRDWELKGQRSHTGSLITFKHIEPSPTGAKIVVSLLLPNYGWKHNLAGTKYPQGEMSFRSTTSATGYTNRGFTIVVDSAQNKLRFVFDAKKADVADPEIAAWLKYVGVRIGLGPLTPEPYWGFDDLRCQIGAKMKNCFYAVADSKMDGGTEFFRYTDLYILSGFSFEKFLDCLKEGTMVVDFDARTGHNHGTKFRFKQGHWIELYSDVQRVI